MRVAAAVWFGAAVQLLTAGAAPAGRPSDVHPLTTYQALRSAAVEPSTAFAIDGLRIERSGARLEVARGIVYPLQLGEWMFGAVILGDGRFQLEPPVATEQSQLERFTKERQLDASFDRLLLLFSDDAASLLRAAATGVVPARGDPNAARDYLNDRRRHQRERLGVNWDARLLRDRIADGSGLFLAEVKTRQLGVVTFIQDLEADEQVRVEHWSKRFAGFHDTWCSYATGPPAGPEAVIDHYQISVRLDRDKLTEETVVAHLRPIRGTPSILAFELHPYMEVLGVQDERGQGLDFVREQMRDGVWEPDLWVLLSAPLDRPRQLVFNLGGDIIEDHHGGQYGVKVTIGWYPRLGYHNRSTYELRFDAEVGFTVLASARKVDDQVVGGRRLTSWRQDFPVSSVAFNYGAMRTTEVDQAGMTPVTVLGEERGFVIGDVVLEVGEQVAKSLDFFSRRFGPHPFERMNVARIPYAHGQGFPGLLRLSESTFGGGWRGADEAFRGHEVAHQWWGHLVGWKTYRDQWLSEGFAVYSGAWFAADVLDDPSILERMLKSWRNDVLGTGNIERSLGFSQFGHSREMMKFGDGSAAGPISLGRRLRSSQGPLDYTVLVYEKGAWIVHMLRRLMGAPGTDDDSAFSAMMCDFVDSHYGSNATTADFRTVVERHVGQDMEWFFDQWVDGTIIPEYRWGWRREESAAGPQVRLRVEQKLEEGESFRMPVPIRLQLRDGTERYERVDVVGERVEFVFELPSPAERVEFNPGDAVLCKERSKRF